METTLKYTIVCDYGISALSRLVNGMIKEGWIPQGSVAVLGVSKTNVPELYQAVVKPEATVPEPYIG